MEVDVKKINWIDGVKAFAILAILLNHLVESFGPEPWFSNPSSDWPAFSVRMDTLFPKNVLPVSIVQFLGWLGDMAPGVFLLLSGLTLTMSALNKPLRPRDFYRNRLLRIYPLYIVVHIVILMAAKFWFKWDIHFFSVRTLLSLLGLRFTGSLFFYINPSWWFIWAIIQMYLLFPFLLHLLKKSGTGIFLFTTLVLTILSRSFGIIEFTHSENLYYWMTGIFAGTRLFEFTFGMYLGYLLYNNDLRLKNLLANRVDVLVYSLLIYVAGFLLSWTYIGSVFSNIFISIGLSGLFYATFKFIFKKNTWTTKGFLWIGVNSFSVFLLHQPFLMYAVPLFKGVQKVTVLVAIIILSFVAGYFIEKLIAFGTDKMQTYGAKVRNFSSSTLNISLILAAIAAAASISFGIMLGFSRLDKILKMLLIILFLAIVVTRFNTAPGKSSFTTRFFDVAAFLSFTVAFITKNWLSTYWALLAVSLLPLLVTYKLRHFAALLISVFFLFASVLGTERYLRKNRPVEVLSWGEFPALQMDSQTVYSLIPNKITHLKYNNYNYYIRTNSYGFNSPEIDLHAKAANERRIMVIGDAFSMPEGLDYNSSYPFLLEQKLRAYYSQFNINIINAGVTGYGPLEEYAQLNKYISIIKPDIVINQFFINDFDDINILKDARRKGIGFFLDKSLKSWYLGNDQTPLQLDNFAQKEFSIINKKEISFETLLPFYRKCASFYDDTVVHKVGHYFDEMKNLCSLNGSKYIVMFVPGQIEVSKPKDISYYPYFANLKDTTLFDFSQPQITTKDLCAEKNIDYLNTTNYLKDYPEQPVYFKESWHWNKEGHKAIANYLFNFMLSNNLL